MLSADLRLETKGGEVQAQVRAYQARCTIGGVPWVLDCAKQRAGWRHLLHRVDWQWSVTLTNEYGYKAHTIKALVGAQIQRLGRSLFRRSWNKQTPESITWAFVVELTLQDVAHVHLLLRIRGRVASRSELEEAFTYWQQRAGYLQIKPVSDNKGAIRYVTKCVQALTEISVSPGFPSRRESRLHVQDVLATY